MYIFGYWLHVCVCDRAHYIIKINSAEAKKKEINEIQNDDDHTINIK